MDVIQPAIKFAIATGRIVALNNLLALSTCNTNM
jgi:hypothetical protein